MTKKTVFLFPGQGAQYVGMGKDFYDQFPIAKRTFEEADEILSAHFSRLIFQGPENEITLTKNSQLAIYIVSIAIWRTVTEQFPELRPDVCAGLSLGEYTALTAAGKIAFQECVPLVRSRAQFMHEASLNHPGTMQVVLGLAPEAVEEAIRNLPKAWVANLNCPGQVVIAGTQEALAEAASLLKEKGAKRVLSLDVSGAFHSGLMLEAQEKLAPQLNAATLLESSIEIVMNVPGNYVRSCEEIKQALLNQVTQPVLWEKGVRSIEEVEFYYEMGPGKTLSGMNKRIGTLAPTLSVEKVTDLEEIANAAIT
jgi:[acyl-carrier-protein] S-malonyltransferase